MAKQYLFSFEVTPGMMVAEDLYNPQGTLVLPKGFILDEATIAKLEYYAILEVPVDDAPVDVSKPSVIPDVNNNTSFSESIRKSEDFIKFKSNYANTSKDLKSEFQNIINHKNIDTDKVFESTMELIANSKNTIHIFDFLHNMREYDDVVTSHSINVALLSNTLGQWLGLSTEDVKVLTVAALLHDVGKLTIPTELLNKVGKLTDEEYEIMRSHVKKGYALLRDLPLDIRVKETCLLHHERCDGSGYPFKAVGSKITPFAKIVAIADVYDAMTASRAYRGGICPFDVIRLFDDEGLNKYDPHYIMTFLNRITETYLHNDVKLSDGSIGEIIMINPLCLYRPIVRVNDRFVDLMKRTDLKIVATV